MDHFGRYFLVTNSLLNFIENNVSLDLLVSQRVQAELLTMLIHAFSVVTAHIVFIKRLKFPVTVSHKIDGLT
jgi:hypothetical protein